MIKEVLVQILQLAKMYGGNTTANDSIQDSKKALNVLILQPEVHTKRISIDLLHYQTVSIPLEVTSGTQVLDKNHTGLISI